MQWGAFQDDGENKKEPKDFDEYDLLHHGIYGKREQAYRFKNRILCQKLSNNNVLQYDYFYHKMDIIELYEYAAIGLATHHVSK